MPGDVFKSKLKAAIDEYLSSQPRDWTTFRGEVLGFKMTEEARYEVIFDELFLFDGMTESEDVIFNCHSNYSYNLPKGIFHVTSKILIDLPTGEDGLWVDIDYGVIADDLLLWDSKELSDDEIAAALDHLHLSNHFIKDDEDLAEGLLAFLTEDEPELLPVKQRLAGFWSLQKGI